MKKLIAISVVFALVAGVAFAVDLGGAVIGTVNVIQVSSDSTDVKGSAGLSRIRIEGGGEVADGKFGGWLRIDPLSLRTWSRHADPLSSGFAGYVWWKPIDQLKLGIGNNGGDGFWGKDGNAAYGFYQQANDSGVVSVGNNWGGGYAGGIHARTAFFGGLDYNSLFLEISPVDMVGINIAIPFFSHYNDIGQIFMGTLAQVDLKMSFGNIAFTFRGDKGKYDEQWAGDRNPDIKNSEIFGFFSLTAIDNLTIDFGLGSDFQNTPINLGFAVKYATDSWGIKFRSVFAIPISGDSNFGMFFDVLPYFVINESFRAFVSVGMGIEDIEVFTANAGWHVNPYIEIGGGWGSSFYAGLKVYVTGGFDKAVKFEIPIGLIVKF